MNHPATHGEHFNSPGGGFVYSVLGPVCRLYDRDELPFPACRLAWKSKEPSWNRVGPRFVPDMAASRCPSYSVVGADQWGTTWSEVVTMYHHRLRPQERHWWYTKKPVAATWPDLPTE